MNLNLDIGILTHNRPEILKKTMDSNINNGLFELVNNIFVYVNDNNIEEYKKLENQYKNINFIFPNNNYGIGYGIKYLFGNIKSKHFLFLEDDFINIKNKIDNKNQIELSISLLNQDIDVVRLRNLKIPGEPLWYRDDQETHIINSLYLKEYKNKYKDKFEHKNSNNINYYISTSKHANFTNNPCMYKSSFFKNTIDKYCYSVLEDTIQDFWQNSNFKVVQLDGLFSHL